MRTSRLALMLVLLLALGLPLLAAAWRWSENLSGVVELRARMPQAGGWSPADIRIPAGEDLRLRLTSDDVMHSFAVGQSSLPAIDLYPGKTVETTLRFDKPGKYTYYCTRWCGADHWRMRGTIEVTGPGGEYQPAAPEQPLFVTLGLDIDAPHPAAVLPAERPSARRGASAGIDPPGKYLTRDYYRTHSPAQAWQDLRQEATTQKLDDQQVWDVVAWVWQQNAPPPGAETARALYARDCAACHGENGAGDGVFAKISETPRPAEHGEHTQMEMSTAPAAFSDPVAMLGASPALLHGKIVRGGMGTGMPYWGPVYTDDQIWALVHYLYSFQFTDEVNE
jgi:mono/diheme cytochrome c family protein/plastocyanin